MGVLVVVFVIMCSATLGSSDSGPVNVMTHGAVGDGKTDDSKAFKDAWEEVCESSSDLPRLVVPSGKTFLLSPINFQGPCKSSSVFVSISGNIVAPEKPWGGDDESWLMFTDVNRLVVGGDGEINGRGEAWWKSCPTFDNCMRPTTLRFLRCNNLSVRGLRSTNSPRNHISVTSCDSAHFSMVTLAAPDDSPNTDGFNIASSTNLQISDSHIGTGDDCIAINTGSSNITISRVNCGPGHGISIGSLGIGGTYAFAEDIRVQNCTFTGTQNGARIKTWQGGSGYVRNIAFDDIVLKNSGNPILIDQFYCPHDTCETKAKAVVISDVSFTRVRGTSLDSHAIALNCSNSVPCTNITVIDVDITAASPGEDVQASCNNARGTITRSNPLVSCLDSL